MAMVKPILLLLIGTPLLEIAVFVEVGARIGAAATVALVLTMAIGGILALRGQGLATLRRAQTSLDRGVLPVKEVFDGLSLLLAGALLVFPGFVTDAIGLLLFIPAVRHRLGRWLQGHLIASGKVRFPVDGNLGPIIDGQYEDLGDSKTQATRTLPPRDDANR